MEKNVEHTWEENEIRIRQIWPLAQWGDEGNALRTLFKSKLSSLIQKHLYVAINEVKTNFTSQQPELKWFFMAYDKIVENTRKTESGATKSVDKFWVDFEQISNHTGVFYACSTECENLESAKKLAAETNGRVRNRARKEVETDELTQFLLLQPRKIIEDAITTLRTKGFIKQVELSGDISKWRPSTIGFVAYQVQKSQQTQEIT